MIAGGVQHSVAELNALQVFLACQLIKILKGGLASIFDGRLADFVSKVVLCAVDEQQHAESNRGLNRNELPDHAQSYKMSLFYEYSMT